MGIMDTRYPAYIVKTGRDGRLINQLRRLEPDRKKGIIVRQESGFGLFGEIERTIRPKEIICLKKGQSSRSGICAEDDLYICVIDDADKETVFRFTMNVHWSAMRKYLEKYIKRQPGKIHKETLKNKKD